LTLEWTKLSFCIHLPVVSSVNEKSLCSYAFLLVAAQLQTYLTLPEVLKNSSHVYRSTKLIMILLMKTV